MVNIFVDTCPMAGLSMLEFPTVRGQLRPSGGVILGQQTLPTDSIGNTSLTLTGVKAGSEIKIISKDLIVLDGTESATGNSMTFTIPRYAAGSAYNTIRVLIIGLGYEVWDFNTVLNSATITIPIFQRIDRTYRNPT